jgi:hypothetical protein
MGQFYSFGAQAALEIYGLSKVADAYGGGTAGMSDADKRALGIDVSTNPIPPQAPPAPEQASGTPLPNQPPVYTGPAAQTGVAPSNLGGGLLNNLRRTSEMANVGLNKAVSNFQTGLANTQAHRAATALPITQP